MQQLILHIGMHKTGSTALQRFLSSIEEELLNIGILYPMAGRPDTHPDGHHLLAWSLLKIHGISNEDCWYDLFEEISEKNIQKVLLSTEGFSIFSYRHIKRLKSLVNNFDVKVIIYIRNPINYLISNYKMGICYNFLTLPFREYANKEIHRCDYDRILKKWVNAFGRKNIDIRIYDKISDADGTEKDFLKAIGINSEKLYQCTSQYLNESPPDGAVMAVRFLNVLQQRPMLHIIDYLIEKTKSAIKYYRPAGRLCSYIMENSSSNKLYSNEDIAWLKNKIINFNKLTQNVYLNENDRKYIVV